MNNKLTFLFFLVFVCLSCRQKLSDSKVNNTKLPADTLSTLKDIQDYRLSLLGNPIVKVDEILGKADDKGESYSYKTGHYIYYNKVVDGGKIKHLVIYYARVGRNAPYRTVEDIQAIEDGGTYTNPRYGTFVVKMPRDFGKSIKGATDSKSVIDAYVKGIEFYSLETYDDTSYAHGKVTFYYDAKLSLKVILLTSGLPDGGQHIISYYFDNEKLRFVSSSSTTGGLITSDKYVAGNNVFLAYYDGVEKPCDDVEGCDFDENSEPYRLLDLYYSNQGD